MTSGAAEEEEEGEGEADFTEIEVIIDGVGRMAGTEGTNVDEVDIITNREAVNVLLKGVYLCNDP